MQAVHDTEQLCTDGPHAMGPGRATSSWGVSVDARRHKARNLNHAHRARSGSSGGKGGAQACNVFKTVSFTKTTSKLRDDQDSPPPPIKRLGLFTLFTVAHSIVSCSCLLLGAGECSVHQLHLCLPSTISTTRAWRALAGKYVELGNKVYSATLCDGELLWMPPCFLVAEVSQSKTFTHGIRMPCVQSEHAKAVLQMKRHLESLGKSPATCTMLGKFFPQAKKPAAAAASNPASVS